MDIEQIFKMVLDCSFKVHTALGPGLLESSYEECLYYEIKKSGLKVENKVIIEIKSVESLAEIDLAQILTYLKLSGCKLGLLVNFNVKHLKNGIKRVIN